jgi:hypothetical protein
MAAARIASFLRAVVAVALAIAAATAKSPALPGQSIVQFKTWAGAKKLLAGIVPVKDELSGATAFRVQTTDHGITWRFYASGNGTTIERESVSVSQIGKEPGSDPIRHDGEGYGFQFFKALYGSDIAADFRSAHSIAAVKDLANGQITQYFAGRHFGYALTGGSVTVETLAALQKDRALAKRCAASPQSCSE